MLENLKELLFVVGEIFITNVEINNQLVAEVVKKELVEGLGMSFLLKYCKKVSEISQ